MDIVFEIEKQDTVWRTISASLNGETIGYARIRIPDRESQELHGLWMTEMGKEKLSRTELAEQFFAYLKEQGCTKLFMESEYLEDGEELGFQLKWKDNAGWYPKYFFCREL